MIVLIGLTKVLERRDVFAWIFFLQALLALGTGPFVWADLYSYGRVLGLLYFAFALCLLTNPRRAAMFPVRLQEWTMPVPGWVRIPRANAAAVTPAS